MGELYSTITRERVLDANEMLDALEEAEDRSRAKSQARAARGGR